MSKKLIYQSGYNDIPNGQFVINFTSYGGNAGTWYHHPGSYDATGVAQTPSLTAQDNGLFFTGSSVRLEDITDGTSNTFMFAERAHGLLAPGTAQDWHWWFDGVFRRHPVLDGVPRQPAEEAAIELDDGFARQRLCRGSLQLPSRRRQFLHGRRVGQVHQGDDQLLGL